MVIWWSPPVTEGSTVKYAADYPTINNKINQKANPEYKIEPTNRNYPRNNFFNLHHTPNHDQAKQKIKCYKIFTYIIPTPWPSVARKYRKAEK